MPCGGCGDNCKCTSSQCSQTCKCDSSCTCTCKKGTCAEGDCSTKSTKK